jgi:hypothetical protein
VFYTLTIYKSKVIDKLNTERLAFMQRKNKRKCIHGGKQAISRDDMQVPKCLRHRSLKANLIAVLYQHSTKTTIRLFLKRKYLNSQRQVVWK